LNLNVPKPNERSSRPKLRYRIADSMNDRLKAIPFLHATLKGTAHWFQHRKDPRGTAAPANLPARPQDLASSDQTAQEPNAHPEGLANRNATIQQAAARKQELVREEEIDRQPATHTIGAAGSDETGQRAAPRLDLLSFPPEEMRRLVGPVDLESFDNPTGALVYPYLPAEVYEAVFDFGCGCGRVARQLLQQRPSPTSYVGVDLHAGMIRWCNENLNAVAPHFTFYHHDVYNVASNPDRDKPMTAPFPVADSQFTLVNAHSVFTHLTEQQAEHYLRECARVLHPQGILHGSWFLFDKEDYPMIGEGANALYLSYADPSSAVIFDRKWVQDTARKMGLRIYQVYPPSIRGHQWVLLMTRRTDVAEVGIPADTAPRGVIPGWPPATSGAADG